MNRIAANPQKAKTPSAETPSAETPSAQPTSPTPAITATTDAVAWKLADGLTLSQPWQPTKQNPFVLGDGELDDPDAQQVLNQLSAELNNPIPDDQMAWWELDYKDEPSKSSSPQDSQKDGNDPTWDEQKKNIRALLRERLGSWWQSVKDFFSNLFKKKEK